MTDTEHSEIVQSLLSPSAYSHSICGVELVQTHISWVFLTGDYAYKVKKPVNFGFVDFSTLERRKHFCEEELRLNGRLAPDLYLDVMPIVRSDSGYRVGGSGAPVEYCVRMRQFDQNCLLSRVVDRGKLRAEHIDKLARYVAEFHARIDRVADSSRFGEPDSIAQPIQENLAELLTCGESADQDLVDRLRQWTEDELARLRDVLTTRKRDGFVRECHGDMHLNNMLLADEEIAIFDGIEFNESLRWIDVLSEVAFTVMDLAHRGHVELGTRFLNGYLEWSGDYAGMPVFRLYLVYRALVRAKVAALRLSQEKPSDSDFSALQQEIQQYLRLADDSTRWKAPFLAITHGISGSGKTYGSQMIVDQAGAIRVRSDVERKRLAGVLPLERTGSAVLYSQHMTEATYERLAGIATVLIRSGYPVVVDATFLRRGERLRFRDLAAQLDVEFLILDFQADESMCRERIRKRAHESRDASDATLSVLDQQLRSREALSAEERTFSVPLDTSQSDSMERAMAEIARVRACRPPLK